MFSVSAWTFWRTFFNEERGKDHHEDRAQCTEEHADGEIHEPAPFIRRD
jgi:hypothetical protein